MQIKVLLLILYLYKFTTAIKSKPQPKLANRAHTEERVVLSELLIVTMQAAVIKQLIIIAIIAIMFDFL